MVLKGFRAWNLWSSDERDEGKEMGKKKRREGVRSRVFSFFGWGEMNVKAKRDEMRAIAIVL